MFYSEVLGAIKPKLKCPLKAGNYTLGKMGKTLIDLTVFKVVALEGYVWILTIKVVTSAKGSKIKKVSACSIIELKVTRKNQRV